MPTYQEIPLQLKLISELRFLEFAPQSANIQTLLDIDASYSKEKQKNLRLPILIGSTYQQIKKPNRKNNAI